MSTLRLLHRWIGLTLALPLLIQALTGFLMLMSPPLDELTRPEAAVTDVPPEPLSAVVHTAQEAVAAALVPVRYQWDGAGTATVDFAAPAQRFPQLRIYIDPVSLMILGQVDRPDATYRWVHRVHETFLLPVPYGRSVVGWCGIGLLVLALTGIPVWWPRHGRWRAALTVPANARGYRLQRSLHGAAGGWVVLLLILQALSGTTMAFPQIAASLLDAPERLGDTRVPRGSRDAPSTIDLDAIAETLRAAVPHASLVSLRFPTEPNRPMIAALQPDTTLEEPPVLVFIDPASHRILSTRDPRAESAGASLLAWLRTLHEGAAFGVPWRAAVAVTGLALVLFPITGCTMWLLRNRERRRRRVQQALPQGAGE
jgi:uncharacterized iron-regulated membrane protein